MIDWNRVNELRNEVGEDDFLEVAELFLEEVDEVILRLTNQPEPGLFEDDLHFLKGCALNLGFSAFSDLCAAGEKLAALGSTAQVDLSKVITSYHASRGQFTTQLGSTIAA